MSEQEKFFVGERKVKAVEITDLTTPAGGSIYRIIYEGNMGEELMTDARWNAVRTRRKGDATEVRDRVVREAGKKLYALLMEYGPYLFEVDHILNEAVRLANDATEQANNALWGKEHSSERSLLDVNNVLLKKYGKNESTEPKPEEGTPDDESAPERGPADPADKA